MIRLSGDIDTYPISTLAHTHTQNALCDCMEESMTQLVFSQIFRKFRMWFLVGKIKPAFSFIKAYRCVMCKRLRFFFRFLFSHIVHCSPLLSLPAFALFSFYMFLSLFDFNPCIMYMCAICSLTLSMAVSPQTHISLSILLCLWTYQNSIELISCPRFVSMWMVQLKRNIERFWYLSWNRPHFEWYVKKKSTSHKIESRNKRFSWRPKTILWPSSLKIRIHMMV